MNNVYSLQYTNGNVSNAIWTNNGQYSQPNYLQQQIQPQLIQAPSYAVQQMPFQVQQIPIQFPYGQLLQSNINQLRIPVNSNFMIASHPLQNYQQQPNQHLQQPQVQQQPSPVPQQQQQLLPQTLQVPQQMSPSLHQSMSVQTMSPAVSEPRSVESVEQMSPVISDQSSPVPMNEDPTEEEKLRHKERKPGSGRRPHPVTNPKLKLKTPIAYDKKNDPSVIPILKDGMGFDVWDTVLPGVKVEVNTPEVTDYNENVIWVATIIKVFGYKALLRYEGMEKISTYDFWLSLVSPRIHYVGWAASKGKSLTPPKCLLDTNTDWRSFLTKRLTNSTTLPVHFFMKINESMKTRFAVGQHVEVIDKTRLSVIRMAVIREIIGKRLHVVYTDGDDDDDDYWCHEDSSNLHPVGWAQKVGHPVFAVSLYSTRTSAKKNDQNAAPESSFRVYQIGTNAKLDVTSDIKIGMKLEVLDPWNIAFMGVATVKKLLKFGFIMISVDTYDVQKEVGSDWYCYHIHSPYVFPVGYCEQNQLPLHPPFTYENTTFRWNEYLRSTHSLPVPQSCFKRWSQINHRFSTNMKIEAVDLMTPKLVCVATIADVKGRHLKITFDGWGDDYDQWIDCSSPEIYPVGWCEVAGYRLESPRTKESALSTNDDSTSSNGNGNVSSTTSRSSNSHSSSQSKKKRGRKRKTTTSTSTLATGAVTRAVSSASPSLTATASQPNRTQSPMLTSQPNATTASAAVGVVSAASQQQQQQQQPPPLLVPLSKKPNVLPATAPTTLPLKRSSSVLSNGNDSLTPSVPLTRSQLKSSDSMSSRTTKSSSSSSAVNHHQHQNNNNATALGTSVRNSTSAASSDDDSSVPSSSATAETPAANATASAASTPATKPFIPCFLNRTLTGSEESLLNPESWTCENVSEYLKINNCASYADAFVTHEIDGSVFLTMSYDDIRLVTNNKAGPSLKIRELIDKLNRIKSLRKIKNK